VAPAANLSTAGLEEVPARMSARTAVAARKAHADTLGINGVADRQISDEVTRERSFAL